ncbi:hypothetical protein [Pseudomonas coronafaciens]|uniref:hypothetical protein n=1 Tax=Pseudomonas coronafaciens TaxID=53409 RepID=UPI0012D807E4|nr:hypothetical protein [Pseudomonas coronafaciens]
MIIDSGTTTATLFGFKIGTIVMITDAAATGKCIRAEHQQHCKNQLHLTRHWVCKRKQSGTI